MKMTNAQLTDIKVNLSPRAHNSEDGKLKNKYIMQIYTHT